MPSVSMLARRDVGASALGRKPRALIEALRVDAKGLQAVLERVSWSMRNAGGNALLAFARLLDALFRVLDALVPTLSPGALEVFIRRARPIAIASLAFYVIKFIIAFNLRLSLQPALRDSKFKFQDVRMSNFDHTGFHMDVQGLIESVGGVDVGPMVAWARSGKLAPANGDLEYGQVKFSPTKDSAYGSGERLDLSYNPMSATTPTQPPPYFLPFPIGTSIHPTGLATMSAVIRPPDQPAELFPLAKFDLGVTRSEGDAEGWTGLVWNTYKAMYPAENRRGRNSVSPVSAVSSPLESPSRRHLRGPPSVYIDTQRRTSSYPPASETPAAAVDRSAPPPQPMTISSRVDVTCTDEEFSEYMAGPMLGEEEFQVGVTCGVEVAFQIFETDKWGFLGRVVALVWDGNFRVPGLVMNKVVEMKGLAALPNTQILSMVVTGSSPTSLFLRADAVLTNPSQITLDLDCPLVLDMWAGGEVVGECELPTFLLPPGPSAQTFAATFNPQLPLSTSSPARALLSHHVSHLTYPLSIRGRPDSTPIPYLSSAISMLCMDTMAPGIPLSTPFLKSTDLRIPLGINVFATAGYLASPAAKMEVCNPFGVPVVINGMKADITIPGSNVRLAKVDADLRSDPVFVPPYTTVATRDIPARPDVVSLLAALGRVAGVPTGERKKRPSSLYSPGGISPSMYSPSSPMTAFSASPRASPSVGSHSRRSSILSTVGQFAAGLSPMASSRRASVTEVETTGDVNAEPTTLQKPRKGVMQVDVEATLTCRVGEYEVEVDYRAQEVTVGVDMS